MAAGQLPADFAIATWLESLGLGQYVEAFQRHEITPELLPSLTDHDLEKCGIEILGHRVRIMLAIRQLPTARREHSSFGSQEIEPVSLPASFAERPKPSVPKTLQAQPVSKRVSSATVPSAALPVRASDGVRSVPSAEPAPVPERGRLPWKRMGGSFLFLSIAAHILFGLGATYFIVQTIQAKRKLTFQAGPKSPNPSQRAIEHKVSMAKKQSTMSAPAQPKRITTTGPSKVALPDMPAMPKMDDFIPGKMAGTGGTGVGLKGGTMGAAGMSTGSGRTISMFGLKVQATHLGVILDVSNSTHGVLADVISEVEKNFAKAETVLVTGCGMRANAKDADVIPISKMKPDGYPNKHPIAILRNSKSEKINGLPERMKKRQDVFFVEGGEPNAAHHAFEHLIKAGVDAIYWFADFTDPLDAEMVEEITKKAANRKIKVYIHSILSIKPPQNVQDMAKKTGGELIIKEPPKKKS